MRLLIHAVILCLFFLTNLAHAEGAVTVISTPPDAEIYVNGTLKANTTPAYLKLPAGTYQIQVKRPGWETQEFPVVLADEVALVKKVQLVETKPVVVDLQAMLFPVRDPFETKDEFTARRQALIKQFNDAADKGDLSYRAGVARLNRDGYDIDNQTFPLEITWDAWATKFNLATSGELNIAKDQARRLWNEGVDKSVFLLLKLSAADPTVTQVSILGIQQSWEVKFPRQEQRIKQPKPKPIIQPATAVNTGDVVHNNYIIHPDGTVTDTKTGLMWKRCSEGQVWDGSTCVGSADEMTWDEAMPHEKQKSWPKFAKYSDWRVPTIEELLNIAVEDAQPIIDTAAFSNIQLSPLRKVQSTTNH